MSEDIVVHTVPKGNRRKNWVRWNLDAKAIVPKFKVGHQKREERRMDKQQRSTNHAYNAASTQPKIISIRRL